MSVATSPFACCISESRFACSAPMRASVSLTIALSTAVESPSCLCVGNHLSWSGRASASISARVLRMLSSAILSASSGVSDTASEYFHFALNRPTPERQSTVPRFGQRVLHEALKLGRAPRLPAARPSRIAQLMACRA